MSPAAIHKEILFEKLSEKEWLEEGVWIKMNLVTVPLIAKTREKSNQNTVGESTIKKSKEATKELDGSKDRHALLSWKLTKLRDHFE